MDNNIDFKKMWAQNESPATIDEVFVKLDRLKKAGLRKIVMGNILLLSTTAFILYIWYAYQPQFLSTKIGIVLVIMAILVFLSVYNQLTPLLKKLNNGQSSHEYLQNLIALRTKQQFLQVTMLNLYFIMLSSGICLYMYEYASRMTFAWATFAYGITLAWIAFNWFYLRPKTIKKEQGKINEIIAKLERIGQQLKEE